MDTEGVRLFVVAAELLNISAAGRQLGLAPAVASARLAKLENQIGADLLHRSTRKVSLSLEGAEFLPYAREILAQEAEAMAALGHHGSEVKGTIRVAASSTFAQRFVVPFLPEFLDCYPKVNLDLKLTDMPTNLIEGGFDLALRNYEIEDSSLIGRKVAEDERVLCAAPSYLKKHGVPETPEELINHQLLVFVNATARKLTSKLERRACTFPPPKAKHRITCDDGTSMRIAAESGIGICMSSIWSIHQELASGSLVRVLPEFEVDDKSAIWLVYPKSNVLTAKVRVLIDFLLEKIADPPIWKQ